MKWWIAAPLMKIESINERLDSIEDLNDNAIIMNQLMNEFWTKISDLEKKLSRLYKYSINQNQKAIYFENVSLNKLNDLKSTLEELEGIQEIIIRVDRDVIDSFKSVWLR